MGKAEMVLVDCDERVVHNLDWEALVTRAEKAEAEVAAKQADVERLRRTMNLQAQFLDATVARRDKAEAALADARRKALEEEVGRG